MKQRRGKKNMDSVSNVDDLVSNLKTSDDTSESNHTAEVTFTIIFYSLFAL